MAIFVPRFVRQLRDVLLTAPADGEVLTYDSADDKWKNEAGGGGGLTFAQVLTALAAIGVTIDPLTGAVTISPSDAVPANYTDVFRVIGTAGVVYAVDSAGQLSLLVRDPGADGLNITDQSGGTSGRLLSIDVAGGVSDFFVITGDSKFSIFTGIPVVQQTAASIGDLWTALQAYGWLDAGSVAPTIGGAPTTATYITQTPDAGLSAEQALSALATGLVKNTTGTGVLSIGAQGTDYWAPGGTDVALADGGTGSSTAAGARTNLGLVIGTDVPAQATFDDHSARHESGGADAIKLDDFATPDDNADLNASTTRHGLLRKLSNTATEYLDGTGAWSVPAGGGGVVAGRDMKTGLYYNCLPDPVADGTAALVQDRVFYVPFPVDNAFTADRVSLGVAVAGTAGAKVRLGFYNDDGNGQPGTLLLDAGVINGDSNTYQEITINQAFAAGTLYWVAVCWQVASIGSGTVRGTAVASGASWFVGKVANSTDVRTSNYTQSGVTGAYASPAVPVTTNASFTNPNVRVRVA